MTEPSLPPGYVWEHQVAAGTAVRTGSPHSTLDAVQGHLIPQRLIDLGAGRTEHFGVCTVDGEPVDELAVLIKPVAFLSTTQHGTHELSRCFYQNKKFSVGPDIERLGGIRIVAAKYSTERGLALTFDHGYRMFLPAGHCQATWKVAERV